MFILQYYAATHKGEFRSHFESAIAQGLPVFISASFAMEASGDPEIDLPQWRILFKWTDHYIISRMTWSSNSNGNRTSRDLRLRVYAP